jgi:putative heme iron utilization protein
MGYATLVPVPDSERFPRVWDEMCGFARVNMLMRPSATEPCLVPSNFQAEIIWALKANSIYGYFDCPASNGH